MACESDSPKTSRKRIAMCACSHACIEQCTIFKTLLSAARNTDSVWETCVWTHFWPLIIAQFLKVHNFLICETGIIPRAHRADEGEKVQERTLPSPSREVGGAGPPGESSPFLQLPSPGNGRGAERIKKRPAPSVTHLSVLLSGSVSTRPFPQWFPSIFLHSPSCHTAQCQSVFTPPPHPSSDLGPWMSLQGTLWKEKPKSTNQNLPHTVQQRTKEKQMPNLYSRGENSAYAQRY